jgi:hypothetical protein
MWILNSINRVERRFNGGKMIRSDNGDELLLNRSTNVVFVVDKEQFIVLEQGHFPLHKSNSHKASHSDRIVTFVICQRVARVEFAANQRIRINLKKEILFESFL